MTPYCNTASGAVLAWNESACDGGQMPEARVKLIKKTMAGLYEMGVSLNETNSHPHEKEQHEKMDAMIEVIEDALMMLGELLQEDENDDVESDNDEDERVIQ